MSRSSRQVTHVLLTRSRLCPRPKPGSSLHLHVLGTPPAFVLSQDQTLRERHACHPPLGAAPLSVSESCQVRTARPAEYTFAGLGLTGSYARRRIGDGSSLDATSSSESPRSNMLLSFQRPWRPGTGPPSRLRYPGPLPTHPMKKASPERGLGSSDNNERRLRRDRLRIGLVKGHSRGRPI